jgi:hypothetical protein
MKRQGNSTSSATDLRGQWRRAAGYPPFRGVFRKADSTSGDFSAREASRPCRYRPGTGNGEPGLAPRNLGLAIYRIENNWPMKEEEGDGQRRYVEGRFADWVEH